MNDEDRINDIVSRLKAEEKELKEDIQEMKHIVEQVNDDETWTPRRFAIVVAKQQKEVKRLKKALQESLDCEDFEKLLGWK